MNKKTKTFGRLLWSNSMTVFLKKERENARVSSECVDLWVFLWWSCLFASYLVSLLFWWLCFFLSTTQRNQWCDVSPLPSRYFVLFLLRGAAHIIPFNPCPRIASIKTRQNPTVALPIIWLLDASNVIQIAIATLANFVVVRPVYAVFQIHQNFYLVSSILVLPFFSSSN